MDDTCQHAPLPVQPCRAKRSDHALGLVSTPGLNGQPRCESLSGGSPFVQPAGPAGLGPLGIPWVGSSYTECPTSV